MPVALVTGATGLLGMHVVERLLRDGWNVRTLVRDASRTGPLPVGDVELLVGNVLDAAALSQATHGCDVVFHAAAAVTPHGGWEAFRTPNVDGTRNVIAATANAGARLVHASSVAVYGNAGRFRGEGVRTDEDTPLPPLPDHAFYARSKRESERLVLDAHAGGRLWATAVRPDVIYGRYDRQFVPRMARLLRHGFAPIVGGGRTTLAVVHAANVTDGMIRAAATDSAGGRAYNLANDYDTSVEEFFRLAGVGMDIDVRMLRIPHGAAKAMMGAVRAIAPLFVGGRFNAISSASLDFLSRDNPFTSTRARRELGWDPPVHPSDGIPDAFSWTMHR